MSHKTVITQFLQWVLMAGVLPLLAQESEWEIQGVDCPKQFFLSTSSLQLDSSGNPRIAYGSDNLYYAEFNGSEWQFETVDQTPRVGLFAALALDAVDRPHIAYFDTHNDDLRYAWCDDAAWYIEVVSPDASVSLNWDTPTDIALDGSGNPHILFRAEGGLGYARHDGDSWHVQVLGGEFQWATGASLAMDTNDNAHISYYRDSCLNYASWDGVQWLCAVVAEQSGQNSSLVLDENDHPHISHQNWVNNDLAYSWWDGSTWHTEMVDDTWETGERSGIAIDEMGHPHIVYTQGHLLGDLKYAWWNGTEWLIQTVDCGVYLLCPSVSLASCTTPHIAYCSYESLWSLVHAIRIDSSWHSEEVDTGASAGTHVSMALDSLDYPHMSYFDATNKQLRYACWDGTMWSTRSVDSDGCIGTYTSLAIDSRGNPHISYYGCEWDNVIRYAYSDDGYWTITELDESVYSDPGYTSLALDEEDHPHISYCLDTDLNYASWDGAEWCFETVESQGIPFGDCSIAINSLGQPEICYRAHTGMRYASKDSSGWHIELVEASSGYHIALTLDSQDRPHISYCPTAYNGYGPRYAFRSDVGWQFEIIEGWAGVGEFASITLDSSDRPHISYCHRGDWAVKFAWKDGDIWHNGVVDSDLGTIAQTSVTIDSSGYRHIAYYDGLLSDLKYAFSTGEGLWSDTPLPHLTSLQLRIEGPVPCRGDPRIALTVPVDGYVRLAAYDMLGRRAAILQEGFLVAGRYRLSWDGICNGGRRTLSGTYIISAEVGVQRVSKRIVLLR